MSERTFLEEITIRSIGVIDQSTLEISKGLTVLTGETGAGKTMILTALNLILGGKADSALVRKGSERLVASGRFSIPKSSEYLFEDVLVEDDKWIITEIESARSKVENLLEEYKFREALFEVIDLSRKGNQYMQKKEPWIVAKKLAEDPEAQKSIDNTMHLCLQLSANLAILINPFLPNTAKKMLGMMKVVEKMLDWENAGKLKLLSVGYTMRAPEILFRKIEDDEINYQVEKLKTGLASPNPSEGGVLQGTGQLVCRF